MLVATDFIFVLSATTPFDYSYEQRNRSLLLAPFEPGTFDIRPVGPLFSACIDDCVTETILLVT